jgi:hypothetical protein
MSDDHESSQEEPEEDEFETRMRAIEEKAGTIRAGSKMPEPPHWEYSRPEIPGQNKEGDAQGYMGLGVGLSVGYTMVGTVVAGWGIGRFIDSKTGGGTAQAIGTLIGAVFGLAGGIFMIIRAQNRSE